MDDEQPRALAIHRLASGIERAGLAGPARLALDVLAPLDVISAQCALLVSPFTRGSRWQEYTSLLSEERAWQDLRSILERQKD